MLSQKKDEHGKKERCLSKTNPIAPRASEQATKASGRQRGPHTPEVAIRRRLREFLLITCCVSPGLPTRIEAMTGCTDTFAPNNGVYTASAVQVLVAKDQHPASASLMLRHSTAVNSIGFFVRAAAASNMLPSSTLASIFAGASSEA